ncbi:uncharacterized protein LOC103722571 [Phoenix dactylifera]|uniref:Uncharacterized protein LOC103722571 n=1 Tax=Phoenix dactylifera TaxID=42345 RepID=A0A8B7D2D9_PHODC|nr:uncharacterized protein LOC103722571 [Phoenix dactylifera]
MIRVSSGPSGNYGPPPAAAAPASMYSSNLSPLAPPFTVASMTNLSPPPPPPPALQPSSFQPFLAFPSNPPEWSPAAAVAASSASRMSCITADSYRSFPSTGVIKNPCYHRYCPSLQSSGLDPLEPPPEYESYAGVGVGPWNGPFDGGEVGRGKVPDGVSSWMDPSSSYGVPSLQEGVATGGLSTYEDNSYGIWHGKYFNSAAKRAYFGSESSEWLLGKQSTIYGESTTYPYNFSGASVLSPSAVLEGTSYSQIPDSTSVMEPCDPFISNSSYDRYMAQLDSYSTNPTAYNQATACSTSGQVYTPSALISSTMDYSTSKNRYSTVHHAVPYKMIDTGNVASNQKEPSINQFVQCKEGQDEKSRANYSLNNNIIGTVTYEKKFPSSNNSSTEKYMGFPTGGDSGLKIKHLKISDSSNSACRSAQLEDSMQSSSETLDEVNLAVDSPCWKGTPASRQSPFKVGETVCVQPVCKESEGNSCLDKGQKPLPDSVAYSGTPAEHVGNLICGENRKKSSVAEIGGSSSVISLNMQQKSENDYKTGLDCKKDPNRKDVQCADNLREQANEVRKDKNIDSEAKDDNATQCDKKKSTAVDQFTSADGNINPEKGSSSLKLNNIELLIRAMHSSSKLLLSTEWSKDNKLEEDDRSLLWLVIQNLEAFLLRNEKGSVEGSSHVSRLEAACSQNTGLETDAACQSNTNNTHDMKVNMQWIGYNMETSEFVHLFSKGRDINLGKVDGIMQDLGNVLEKSFSDGDDNPRMLLYKNLWIEAEVALCRLKYELQLARMKIEADNRKCQTKGKLPPVTTSPSPSMVHDVNGHDAPLKAKENLSGVCSSLLANAGKNSSGKPHKALSVLSSNGGKSEDLEAFVMDHKRSLKQQTDVWNSWSINEQPKIFDSLDFGVCSGTKETAHSSCSDNENNSGLKQPSIKLADLTFTESSLPSYLNGGPRNSGLVVERQHPRTNSNEDIRLPSTIYGDAATREFCSSSLGGKVIQPSITKKQGSCSLSGGYDSPSSEWEHVLKEDIL